MSRTYQMGHKRSSKMVVGKILRFYFTYIFFRCLSIIKWRLTVVPLQYQRTVEAYHHLCGQNDENMSILTST